MQLSIMIFHETSQSINQTSIKILIFPLSHHDYPNDNHKASLLAYQTDPSNHY